MGECDWDGPGLVGGCGARWYDEHTWHGADLPVASGCMTVIEEDRFGVSGSGLMIRLVMRAVCYPGVIRTNLWRGLPHFLRSLAWLFPDSEEKGAQITLYLATSSEVEQITGKYFVHSKAVEAASQGYD